MNCSISGEPCEHPVITPFGHIFEKDLIEKHIQETGKCPVTDNELKIEDLIYIKTSGGPVRPRPASATSLASLLKLFQNEWDAVMLETFNLKKQFDNVKQELSNSLYEYDAACRVIARLIKERDEARQALADTQNNMKAVISQTNDSLERSEKATMEENEQSKESEINGVVSKITEFAKNLSKKRRKSRKSALSNLITPEAIDKFKMTVSIKLENAEDKISSTSLEILSREKNENIFVVGGISGDIKISSDESLLATLQFHKEKVSQIAVLNEKTFLSGSADCKIVLWRESSESSSISFDSTTIISHHSAAVTGLFVQAMRHHFASCSVDGTWAFFDVATGSCLRSSAAQPAAFSALSFHPDGLIFGTGSADSMLCIWDLKSQKSVASFEGHSGGISSLSFSENGYYLATGDRAGAVKLWDLRKSENLKTLWPGGEGVENSIITQVKFDGSGGYLGCVGEFGLKIFASRTWEVATTLDEMSRISAVSFGEKMSFFATVLEDSDELHLYKPANKTSDLI